MRPQNLRTHVPNKSGGLEEISFFHYIPYVTGTCSCLESPDDPLHFRDVMKKVIQPIMKRS